MAVAAADGLENREPVSTAEACVQEKLLEGGGRVDAHGHDGVPDHHLFVSPRGIRISEVLLVLTGIAVVLDEDEPVFLTVPRVRLGRAFSGRDHQELFVRLQLADRRAERLHDMSVPVPLGIEREAHDALERPVAQPPYDVLLLQYLVQPALYKSVIEAVPSWNRNEEWMRLRRTGC